MSKQVHGQQVPVCKFKQLQSGVYRQFESGMQLYAARAYSYAIQFVLSTNLSL